MTLDTRLLAAVRSPVHVPVSELSQILGIGAENVLERILALNEAGFEFNRIPGVGIKLAATPDRLIADDLFARLGHFPFVRDIVVYEETDSTNVRGAQLAREGVGEGTVIFAETQTAGRGRFGRHWESHAHRGLWFSLILRPSMPMEFWTRLPTWVAVAVAEAVQPELPAGVYAQIKWPNDIYVSGKKLGGILIELVATPAGHHFAVVGIGINVNQESADFGIPIHTTATSLRMVSGRLHDRSHLAVQVLRSLEKHYGALAAEFPQILESATRLSCLLGSPVEILRHGERVAGVAEALSADGALLLRDASGQLRAFDSGEASLILTNGSQSP